MPQPNPHMENSALKASTQLQWQEQTLSLLPIFTNKLKRANREQKEPIPLELK